jgi:predicted phosphoribosyltransferase
MRTITQTGFELDVEGVDGCWVLDRYSHPQLGLSRNGMLLNRAVVAGMGPAAVQLGERMGTMVRQLRLPADVVVAAVPSTTDVTDTIAERVAAVLDRPVAHLLAGRHAHWRRGQLRGCKPTMRHAPRKVLLVADSMASTAMVRSCAALLRERGTEQVWAVASVAMFDLPNAG